MALVHTDVLMGMDQTERGGEEWRGGGRMEGEVDGGEEEDEEEEEKEATEEEMKQRRVLQHSGVMRWQSSGLMHWLPIRQLVLSL